MINRVFIKRDFCKVEDSRDDLTQSHSVDVSVISGDGTSVSAARGLVTSNLDW